jgi:hypothetical protein
MGNRPVTACHGDPIWEFQAFRTAGEATASYRHRGKVTCVRCGVTERGVVRYDDRLRCHRPQILRRLKLVT